MGLTISSYNANTINSLFSSMNGRNSNTVGFDYSMLSEYNSIKSGNYHKLLKNYYSDNTNVKAKAFNEDKKKTVDDMAKQKTEASNLYESASKLLNRGKDSLFNEIEIKDEDGKVTKDYDRDAIYKAAKAFVDDYNSTVDVAKESDVTGVVTATAGMTGLAAANSKNLASIGITIDNENKLSINEDTFKKADMNMVKTLFNSQGSFAGQIASKASMINSSIVAASSMGGYTNSGSLSTVGLMNTYNAFI